MLFHNFRCSSHSTSAKTASNPPFRHRILSFSYRPPAENPFLNVRRQAKQIHDLGHPRSRDVPQTRQVCVVRRDARLYQPFEPVRQG